MASDSTFACLIKNREIKDFPVKFSGMFSEKSVLKKILFHR